MYISPLIIQIVLSPALIASKDDIDEIVGALDKAFYMVR
jgi:adenosylmethionine-8-amino-7-oxononanoate aminotransferase